MKQLHKNRWLLIGLILITIFSSLGTSLSVVGETLDSSSVETSDTLDEQESSSDMVVENEIPIVEPDVQEKVMEDSQGDKETAALDSSEIQSQTRDWSPSPSIQAEAVRNWVSQQLDSYFNLSNEKLGKNVGDKIVKTVNFPDYMGIAAYQGEGNWNDQWHVQLGKTKLDSNGYFKFSNFSFTHSSDISVSLSGTDNDKTRTLTITRLEQSPDERYSIKANYYFESRGVMYNEYGIISGKYNTIYPSGDGKQIDMNLEAQATLGNALVMGQSEYNDNGTIPFTEAFIFQLKGTVLDIGVAGSSPNASIDPKQPSKIVMKAEFGNLGQNIADYFKASGIGFEGNGSDTQGSLINQWTNSGAGSSIIGIGNGDLLHLWSDVSMKDGTNVSRIQRSKESVFYDDNPEKVSDMFYQLYNGEFQPLSITKLKQAEEKIAIDKNVTNQQLESLLKNGDSVLNFSKYPSVSPIGFKTYPNRQNGGQESTAVIQVSEKLKDGKTMYYDYEVIFNVKDDDEKLTVETKEGTVPLGTTGNLINPQEFVKTVRLGERELSSDEYTVELTNKPYTDKIGKYDCKIKVSLKDNPEKEVESATKANIVWGSSIVSKANSTGAIDSSVSLLDNNGVPYLKATEGNGFSSYNGLLSRPRFDVYRETQGNKIFSVTNETVKNTPKKLMNIWNGYFSDAEFKYGDVMSYTVYNYGDASANENGKNTWVSRNNSLTRETQGHRDSLYEFTENGLRLMQINQLKITNGNRVPLNTTKEEMNQNIDKYISIPTHIKNPEDYRMEFESIDTATSGNKTSKINVYQRLQSGGEFMTTYSVNYTVNPEIEETDYDVEGNKISETKKTSFDYGTQFIPSPKKYLEKDDNLYVYKGWLQNTEEPGVNVPKEGIPSPTEKESKFYYIYEKADKYINVTIPTEIVFGTFDNTEEVKSNKYEIKNNSKELTTNVSLDSFREVKTSVKLLGENETPDETKDSARLNLLINDETKIKGLNEAKFNISLADLEPENTATMGINGEYYARTSQINIVEYNTKLKFKAVSGK
ncbi:hypothetical protein [Enterococcus entomosocium]|uniref:hypothetical protein n=1 Tax=Enterococcus entomosocium TaxID=3034352 RepID=UPI003D6BD450